MKLLKLAPLALALVLTGATTASIAQVTVGGAPMVATKDIVDNAVNSKDHTTLVAAVKAAGLVDTLKGTGPFTVFAPTNAAFAALPAGTVDTLLKAESKPMLTTAAGGKLTAMASGNTITVADESGGTANVTIADVLQSNGVIHVVDKVLLPK